MIHYAKERLRLHELELSTATTNVRSQSLPLKFNFLKIDTLKNVEQLDDGMIDHILWRLVL